MYYVPIECKNNIEKSHEGDHIKINEEAEGRLADLDSDRERFRTTLTSDSKLKCGEVKRGRSEMETVNTGRRLRGRFCPSC